MKYTMRNIVIALWVILCFALSACGAGSSPEVSKEVDAIVPSISTLLPERETVQEILVFVDRTFSGEVYAFTSDEEKEALLDKLYEADLSGLQDAEQEGIMGASVSFKLRSENEERIVQVIADSNAQYLLIGNENQQQFKKGIKETFDYEELSRLVSAVLGNEEDPNYSGKVEILDSDFKANVNKGNAAFARSILDEAILKAETVEEGDNIAYDIMFVIGDTSYAISSDTGYFFRQEAEEKRYAHVEEQLLMQVKTRIGVRDATS